MSAHIKKIIWIALGAAVFLGIGLLLFVFALSRNLPSIQEITTRRVEQSTKIYDRTGEILLYEISGDEKRTSIPLEEIPTSAKEAAIVTEDEKFYNEPAFDWIAILRALLANSFHLGIVQGGSTITQQLAKNAFLSPEQTITRKIKELILAVELNRHYSKDEILELYLNEVPYGSNIYGIEAASQTYFGKSAKNLSVAESALLAALLQAPSYYSPWGNHVPELLERQQYVLRRMHELGKINNEEYEAATKTKLVFLPRSRDFKAPHFVTAVQDYLTSRYGEAMVQSGGLRVVTTLDWGMQTLAEKVIAEGAANNERLYKGKNAALAAEDPKTGQILALVGSRDYFDIQNEGNFNVATQGLRQPGSALKPFAYLTAFEKGYTPETTVFDLPTEFVPNNPACPIEPDYTNDNPKCFHPQDFDPFQGPISLRNALAQSVNVAAVKVLYLAGLSNVLDTLKSFGVSTLNSPARYGLSLVLGGGEVKLIDLVGAYATLSQDGVKHAQAMVLEVKDKDGKILESYHDKTEKVVDPQYARLVNDILSDVTARSGLFHSSLSLTVFPGQDVALKTGTTNDYRDAWTFGYTPSIAVGVWAGNNDNAPMQRQGSSILAAVPMWHSFMVEALKDRPTEPFIRPDPVAPKKPILAGDYLAGKQVHNILYYVDRDDPLGSYPTNPGDDPQFMNWEVPVLNWAKVHVPDFASYNDPNAPPPEQGFVFPPQITIQEPSAGAFITNGVKISAQIIANTDVSRVIIYFNNQQIVEVAPQAKTPYILNYMLTPTSMSPQNVVRIEATDSEGRVGSAEVIVYH